MKIEQQRILVIVLLVGFVAATLAYFFISARWNNMTQQAVSSQQGQQAQPN